MSDAGYAQRTDLLAPKAAPGQTYGEAGRQIEAQRAVPMGNPTPSVQQTPKPRPRPGQFGPLDRPTERPQEPVTAGAPFGPGPSPAPMAYMGRRNADPVLDELRALYAAYPSDELADLLDSYLNEGY